MKFEMGQGGGIPVGTYQAEFVRVESREPNQHGQSCMFVWAVTSGDEAGHETTRICGIDRPPTKKNALGRILEGLADTSFEVGDGIDIENYVGQRYLVQVGDSPQGSGTRVESCTKLGNN